MASPKPTRSHSARAKLQASRSTIELSRVETPLEKKGAKGSPRGGKTGETSLERRAKIGDTSTTSVTSEISLVCDKSLVACSIVGGPKVGKTSLAKELIRKLSGVKESSHKVAVQTGFPYKVPAITPSGTPYILSLLDVPSPGLEDDSYILMLEGSGVILLCFSLYDRKSFLQLEQIWIPFVTMLKIHGYVSTYTAAVIIGTKCDGIGEGDFSSPRSSRGSAPAALGRKNSKNKPERIGEDKIHSLVEQLGGDVYLEVSTRTGKGLAKLINEIIPNNVYKGRKSSSSLVKIPPSFGVVMASQSKQPNSSSSAQNTDKKSQGKGKKGYKKSKDSSNKRK